MVSYNGNLAGVAAMPTAIGEMMKIDFDPEVDSYLQLDGKKSSKLLKK